jgi:hypothetical protein
MFQVYLMIGLIKCLKKYTLTFSYKFAGTLIKWD